MLIIVANKPSIVSIFDYIYSTTYGSIVWLNILEYVPQIWTISRCWFNKLTFTVKCIDNPVFFNIPDHFNVYTREAGVGKLSIGIEGPSPAKIVQERRPNGFLGVSYKVEKPGENLKKA